MSRMTVLVSTLLVVVASLFVANNEAVRVRSGAVRLGANPAIVIRLRRSVLDQVFKGATRLVGQHAKKIPLPDVSCTVSGVDLETRNMAISHFDDPQIAYKLAPPNRIIGSLSLPVFGVEGPFNATRRTFIKDQFDSGNLSFVANNIKVSFDASIGQCETGTPNIEKFDCTAEMGTANVNVKNAKEKFAIEVIGLGAKMIRPIVTTQVCATCKRLLLDEVNRNLAKIPNVISLNKNFAFKYQVKPQVSENFVQLGLFGKILTDVVNPDQPIAFNETPAPDAQVVLLISDVVFNELAFHAHANGLLTYTVNKGLHPLVHALFNAKCDCKTETCIGCALPHLETKYGADADIQVTVKADKAPRVAFIPNKATFTASVHVDLAITPAKPGSPTHHETASIEATGSLQPKIHNQRLYAKANVEEVKITIDDERNKQYEAQVHDYCKKTTEEIINDFLFRGLPLNLPFGFSLTDPLITVKQGTLQAHTGVDYKPQQQPPQQGPKP